MGVGSALAGSDATSTAASLIPRRSPLTASRTESVPAPEPMRTVQTVRALGSTPSDRKSSRTRRTSARWSNVPGRPMPATATSRPLCFGSGHGK
jgi:hypothetical protein